MTSPLRYKKKEYLEDLLDDPRLYDIYKSLKRSDSHLIKRYYDVQSGIKGLICEIKRKLEETDQAVALKGIAIFHKAQMAEILKPDGKFKKKLKKITIIDCHIEDEYLRNRYLVVNRAKTENKPENPITRPDAISLHRKTFNR